MRGRFQVRILVESVSDLAHLTKGVYEAGLIPDNGEFYVSTDVTDGSNVPVNLACVDTGTYPVVTYDSEGDAQWV